MTPPVFDLPPGNPWSGLQTWGLPNVKWCEAPVDGWILEPANTWSNLAYVLASLWMWWRWRDVSDPMVRRFGPSALVVGLTSAAYHASDTFVLQVGDFAGMFLFTGLPVLINLRRLGWVSAGREPLGHVLYVIGFLTLLFGLRAIGGPIQLLVASQIVATLATELLVWRRQGAPAIHWRWWAGAVTTLGGAAVCSAADVSRVWCSPHDHVWQGHAVWHVLGAASLVLLGQFYARTTEARPAGR